MKLVLVIPAYNEEKIISSSTQKIFDYCSREFAQDDWTIVIANNASTDNTQSVAEKLAAEHPPIKVYNTPSKGRGHALREVWSEFPADLYFYCDADLSTDISQIRELVDSIKNGADIAIGSRYRAGAKTKRHLKRLIISKVYNWIVLILFPTKIHDFQCGFKAINKKVKEQILPLTKDPKWFFDTELLLLAEDRGYKIEQVPVCWNENRETKVKLVKNTLGFLKCLVCFFISSRIRKKNTK